ncbi:hypothetical protein, partial [Endozoicomonas sp.]|uniref:hypothetical protein n=1 Tax=Endozoicomonas sp. TaxID=1892382 RepID=UPI00383AC7AD
MQKSALPDKNPASPHNNDACSNGSRRSCLSLTLPLLSTLNEKDIKPFWSPQCSEIQHCLWLPRKTSQDSNLSGGSPNYRVDRTKSWMVRLTPLKPSTPQSLSVSLPQSAITSTEKNRLKGAKIIASKKIRFYPENKAAYKEALVLFRRSYNLAVERFLNDSYLDENGKFINMRPAIKAQVYQEQKDKGHAYNSIISDNGTLAAATTFRAVCAKNKKLKSKKGEKESFSDIHFKSRKGSRHSFSIDRLPSGLNPCLASLGRIHLTE